MGLSRRAAALWGGLAVLTLAWVVLVAGTLNAQEEIAGRDAVQSRTAQALLTGLLDQETAIRGYANTGGDPTYLGPFRSGRRALSRATDELRGGLPAPSALRRSLDRQERLARRWEASADRRIAQIAAGSRSGPALDPDGPVARRNRDRMRLVDAYRSENAGFQRTLAAVRSRQASESSRRALLLVVLMGLGLAGGAVLVLLRASRADVRAQEARADFAAALSAVDDEPEAHALLVRHVERAVPSTAVHVLALEEGIDRLGPATALPAGSPLAEGLEGATSRSCLAVRQARVHEQGGSLDPLQRCDLCGRLPGPTTCAPLIVRGRVIGSVLASGRRRLEGPALRALVDGVGQAAPVVGNLRTLARAEAQAATDSLTGLANRRVLEERFARLLAEANRSITPLSVLVLDLDRFKRINDTLGHAAGDLALAAVGRLLQSLPRTSDVAGRWGGEEFVVLLPDTDAAGAVAAAENLRQSIGRLEHDAGTPALSASFGVASYPEHADDVEGLLRLADGALYAAKHDGRDRVAVAEPPGVERR